MTKSIYTEDHKFLTSQLKKARLEAGLKQGQVAKLLGKTQSYISKLEAGQSRIDLVQLKRIAIIYDRNLGYFIKE